MRRVLDYSASGKGASSWQLTAQVAFMLLCIEAIFSVVYRSVLLSRHSIPLAFAGALCVLTIVGIGYVFREPVLRTLGSLLTAPSIGDKTWLSFWLIFGLFLRLAWTLLFPVSLVSDNAIYFDVAAKMSQGQSVASVFNPPGLSLFLAPFLWVFGVHQWVVLICGLMLFVATYFLTYALAESMLGGLSTRVAPMLVAIWPCFFPLVGTNSKEVLLAALVPGTLLLYTKAADPTSSWTPNRSAGSERVTNMPNGQVRWLYVIAAGLCMGFAALTQPGYMLFPAPLLGFEMLRTRGRLKACGRIAAFSLAMLAAILPWTYRNYRAYHRLVLISTNGGSVFYRANNALANAQYEPEKDAPLPRDEFAADKLGYKMGIDWITHHPGDFTVLMVRKQIVFWGDDAVGAFETLKFDLTSPRRLALYAPAKAISNLYWLALWAVLLLGFPLLFRLRIWQLWYGLLFLPLIYQWVIDSVFESGPRHHIPYAASVAVLVGIVLGEATHRTPEGDS